MIFNIVETFVFTATTFYTLYKYYFEKIDEYKTYFYTTVEWLVLIFAISLAIIYVASLVTNEVRP